MDRFEAKFPKTARHEEIKKILDFAKQGKSTQLISVFGAGRSSVLRLLLFNPQIRSFHLGSQEKNYIFLYVNCAEVTSEYDLYKLLFFYLDAASKKNPQLSSSIELLYQKAAQLQDQTLFFQHLKQAFEVLGQHGIVPILLFDRFSEFPNLITESLFANLRSLKSAANGKLSVVFSVHQPIEKISDSALWKHFYEFVVGNYVFLNIKDTQTTSARIALLEAERGKQLSKETIETLLKITGGHGKLTKLSAEILLEQETSKEMDDESLQNFLLEHQLIKAALYEIWFGLTQQQRDLLQQNQTDEFITSLQLPFPLFSKFLHQSITKPQKTLRINSEDNQLYFGDEALEGLTNQEFKLLSFFVQSPNRVLSRDEIINAVWSDSKTTEGVSNEALDQMIFRLRKKIEDESDNPKHLITIKGRGFRFLP